VRSGLEVTAYLLGATVRRDYQIIFAVASLGVDLGTLCERVTGIEPPLSAWESVGTA
jgi:hypothetical protein